MILVLSVFIIHMKLVYLYSVLKGLTIHIRENINTIEWLSDSIILIMSIIY